MAARVSLIALIALQFIRAPCLEWADRDKTQLEIYFIAQSIALKNSRLLLERGNAVSGSAVPKK